MLFLAPVIPLPSPILPGDSYSALRLQRGKTAQDITGIPRKSELCDQLLKEAADSTAPALPPTALRMSFTAIA